MSLLWSSLEGNKELNDWKEKKMLKAYVTCFITTLMMIGNRLAGGGKHFSHTVENVWEMRPIPLNLKKTVIVKLHKQPSFMQHF